MKNTYTQGKSKKIIHTKKFNYIRNAIQMSTNMLLSKYYPVISHSFHQKMSENLLITIRETGTHWLRFYMVDQYRITLQICSYLFLIVLVDDGFTVYVTLIVDLHCFMEDNKSR